MSRLKNYLLKEGVLGTVKHTWNKAVFRSKSKTVFLRMLLTDLSAFDGDGRIEKLCESNRVAFENIKFWDFLKTEEFIDSNNKSIVMIKQDMHYIGYVAEEHEIDREIHGLGLFMLGENEGWIGPAYVCRKWRKQGYNKKMIIHQLSQLKSKSISAAYTAINSMNTASLNSFMSIGFETIGEVNDSGDIICDPEGILHRAYKKGAGK